MYVCLYIHIQLLDSFFFFKKKNNNIIYYVIYFLFICKALKCRERKKLWIEKLTKTHDQRLRKNKILRRKMLELKEEVQHLRNQLIIHSE